MLTLPVPVDAPYKLGLNFFKISLKKHKYLEKKALIFTYYEILLGKVMDTETSGNSLPIDQETPRFSSIRPKIDLAFAPFAAFK